MKVNHFVDLLMLMTLPLLMAYSLIGEEFHEVAGTVIFILFIIHNWQHRKWWQAISKGRYTPYRICITILNILLLILMVCQPITGISMSRHLYSLPPTLASAISAREVHLVMAYWCYVLMSFHLGLHAEMMIRSIRSMKKVDANEPNNPSANGRARFVILPAVFYGMYAFINRNFPDYMLMHTMYAFFDYGESRIVFFVDYLAIMILFASAGYWFNKICPRQ